jgi:hypothetical protein
MPETPQEKLKKMTAWDMEPALAEGDIDELLAANGLVDAAGLAPGDELWTPTYDMNSAAAAGWLIKAGKASCLTEVDAPGSGIMTSKIFDNCQAMAKRYRSRGTMAVPIKPAA